MMDDERTLRRGQGFGGTPGVEKQTRIVASITLRKRMFPAQRFFAGSDGAKEQRLGFGCMANLGQQPCKVVEARRGIGMVRAMHLLADRERALVQRPCLSEVALGLKEESEVVEALGRAGMLAAEHLFVDRQGPFVERPRPGKVALGVE
jgi:hypothetical protein